MHRSSRTSARIGGTENPRTRGPADPRTRHHGTTRNATSRTAVSVASPDRQLDHVLAGAERRQIQIRGHDLAAVGLALGDGRRESRAAGRCG